MLIFKYIEPFDSKKTKEIKKEDIKPVDALVTIHSEHPHMEYQHLKKSIWMMKAIIENTKKRYMYEDFLPEQLKPYSLEPYPGTYTECCAFCDLLEVYYNFLKENKKEIFDSFSKTSMTDFIKTMILIRERRIFIITKNLKLQKLLRAKAREYKKYKISLEEENVYEKRNWYLDYCWRWIIRNKR